MHVLFAISVLALAALLWASAAIVQHIRRSRRRRRLLEDNAHPEASSSLGLAQSSASPGISRPQAPPPLPDAAAAISASLAAGFPASPSMLEPDTLAIVSALEAATHAATHVPGEEPEAPAPQLEAQPAAARNDSDSLAAIAERLITDPPVRALRASSTRHPIAAIKPPVERQDWAYFNKDMGDITDPEAPRGRKRDIKAIKERHKTA